MWLCVLVLATAAAMPQGSGDFREENLQRPPDHRRPHTHHHHHHRLGSMHMFQEEGNYHLDIPNVNYAVHDGEVKLSRLSAPHTSTLVPETESQVEEFGSTPRTNRLGARVEVSARLKVSADPEDRAAVDHQQDAPKTNVDQKLTPKQSNATKDDTIKIPKVNKTAATQHVRAGEEGGWSWGLMDEETTTSLPELDDRAAFDVNACPQGRHRVRSKCVEQD